MFDSFWQQYPRKVAKFMAELAWNKLSTEDQATAMEAIPVHVAYWKAINQEKHFIPHASTWLNQQRFHDEIDMPQPKVAEVAWWGSEQLILAKGRDMNLEPRPGESIHEFKGRIASKIREAA